MRYKHVGYGVYSAAMWIDISEVDSSIEIDGDSWERRDGKIVNRAPWDRGYTIQVLEGQGLDAISFRLKGEESWARVSDYVEVSDGRPTFVKCFRCGSTLLETVPMNRSPSFDRVAGRCPTCGATLAESD